MIKKESDSIKRYVRTVCGYVYDEAKGIPEAGIAPGTSWKALPDDWTCPLCDASKAEFKEEGAKTAAAKPDVRMEIPTDEKELTAADKPTRQPYRIIVCQFSNPLAAVYYYITSIRKVLTYFAYYSILNLALL